MKTVTVNDVITWLQGLPPDTIVYEPYGGEDYCTIATYARTHLGLTNIGMGYTAIGYADDGVRVEAEDALFPFITCWDDRSGTKGLTAAQALAAVRDLI